LPPGAILVLRLAPTPRFFLYKNPGNVDPPNQNCPLEGPEPKADILLYIYISTFKKAKKNKTKQNKTKQNKTKQNKTKQNKTKNIDNFGFGIYFSIFAVTIKKSGVL
jgi:hypothetical protein